MAGCDGSAVTGALPDAGDGNQSNDDNCLNNCTWRTPASQGVNGPGC